MKFIYQELSINASSQREDAHRTSKRGSTEHLVDFLEARTRLSTELAGMIKETKIAEKAYRDCVSAKRSSKGTDTVEQVLYWLISAPTLALSDSTSTWPLRFGFPEKQQT
jgi:hypothetical protein